MKKDILVLYLVSTLIIRGYGMHLEAYWEADYVLPKTKDCWKPRPPITGNKEKNIINITILINGIQACISSSDFKPSRRQFTFLNVATTILLSYHGPELLQYDY